MPQTIQCFLVYKKVQRGRRVFPIAYKPNGLHATVHATSKTNALQLVGSGFTVAPNPACTPAKLQLGDHCINNLIAQHPSDTTPLGHIQPNSPEWERRIKHGLKPISPERRRLMEKMHQRKDIGDAD